MPEGRRTRGQPDGGWDGTRVRLTAPRHMVRQAVKRFLLWDLAVLAVVVTAVVLLSWAIARSEALRDAEVTARAVVETIVAPLADADFHARNPAAMARMGEVLGYRSRDESISHIKVWQDAGDGRGTVLWSDEKDLVGLTFDLEEHTSALFGTEDTASEITDLQTEESQLIEVYTATRDAAGVPILFEVYIPTRDLTAEMLSLIGVIMPLPIAALLVLSLATWPLAVSLARRVDQGQQQMQRLLVNAVESSDLERRRIAQVLHDGVVQDLAGVSYALAGEADGVSLGGMPREHLDEIGKIVRRDIASLRNLMVDIYPPDLETKGLASAVRELVAQEHLPPGLVRCEIDEPLRPNPVTDRLIYRAIREALANALQHAHASAILIRITQSDTMTTFEVVDDGVGFDTAAPARAGHFGLRLISEMSMDAGGILNVKSSVGNGTRLLGELPV
ncbi:MAG: ATP-binding protein [Dermatophilaceae bacterium]